jgi:hypothetical protein
MGVVSAVVGQPIAGFSVRPRIQQARIGDGGGKPGTRHRRRQNANKSDIPDQTQKTNPHDLPSHRSSRLTMPAAEFKYS